MKSIFDPEARDEIVQRINALPENSVRQWGKMNLMQMLRHTIAWDEMVLRNILYRRVPIGRLLGRFFLKQELKENTVMRRDNPSIPELIIRDTRGDVPELKKEWIKLIREYGTYQHPEQGFVHPFFGKMTRTEIGYFAYRHTDHHLRQFLS